MSWGTRDNNLASDTEVENAAKEHPSGFSAYDAARERPQENEGLSCIVRVKSQRRNMMNIQLQKVLRSPKT